MVAGIIALFLFSFRLGSRSLNSDEIYSASLVRQPTREIWRVVILEQTNMAPYYFILKAWTVFFGTSPVAIRSLSVIFAAIAVSFLFVLARRLFGDVVARLSAIFLTVNSLFLFSAQEARAYALVVLTATAAMWLLVRLLDDGAVRSAVFLAAVSAFGAYCHFYFILLIPGLMLSVIAHPLWRSRRNLLLLSSGLLCAQLVPLATFIVTRDAGQIDWITKPSLIDLVNMARSYSGPRPRPVGPLILCTALLALAVWSRDLVRRGAEWRVTMLASALLTPVLLAVAVTYSVKPILNTQYLIVTLPAFCVLVARGALLLPWRPLMWLAVLAALAAPSAYFRTPDTNGWEPIADRVFHQAQPADKIIFQYIFLRRPFDYYRSHQAWPEPAGPPWGHLSMLPHEPLACEGIRPGDRVWIVGAAPTCLTRLTILTTVSGPGSYTQVQLVRAESVQTQ